MAFEAFQQRYECSSCHETHLINIANVQAKCSDADLNKSMMAITDISSLLQGVQEVGNFRISIKYPCGGNCSRWLDVNLLVNPERIEWRNNGTIEQFCQIVIKGILSQSLILDNSWRCIVEDGTQQIYKCRRGHYHLITRQSINTDYSLLLSKIGRYTSTTEERTALINRQCIDCNCTYDVSIKLMNENVAILSPDTKVDLMPYNCQSGHINFFNDSSIRFLPFGFEENSLLNIEGLGDLFYRVDSDDYPLIQTKVLTECPEETCLQSVELKVTIKCCGITYATDEDSDSNSSTEVDVNIPPPVSIVSCFGKEILPQQTIIDNSTATTSVLCNDEIQIYTCEKCDHCQLISLQEVLELDPGQSELSDRLLEIEDTGPAGYPEAIVGHVKISVDITCKKCNEETSVIIKVQPNEIEWDDERENGMPRIDCFYDIEILAILPQTEACDDSLMNCLMNYCEEDDNFDEDDYFDADIAFREKHSYETKNMLIFVKTAMNNGFCYLGLKLESSNISRPITTYLEKSCCWTKNLELDNVYNFTVLSEPVDEIPLPHHRNDILVSKKSEMIEPCSNVFEQLKQASRSNIRDIFGVENIKEGQYVYEGSGCESAGILRCFAKCIRVYDRKRRNKRNQNRIEIKDGKYTYDLPYTGLENLLQPIANEILVVIGLARPWSGPGGRFPLYKPLRCYIIALRVLERD